MVQMKKISEDTKYGIITWVLFFCIALVLCIPIMMFVQNSKIVMLSGFLISIATMIVVSHYVDKYRMKLAAKKIGDQDIKYNYYVGKATVETLEEQLKEIDNCIINYFEVDNYMFFGEDYYDRLYKEKQAIQRELNARECQYEKLPNL